MNVDLKDLEKLLPDAIISYYDCEENSDINSILLLGRALSSYDRIKILQLLGIKQCSLSEIARELNIQPSSVAFHLKILIESGLVIVEENSNQKTVKYSFGPSGIHIISTRQLPKKSNRLEPYRESIPIGLFSDISLDESCGMSSEEEILIRDNQELFSSKRTQAQIIWSRYNCFLEYTISNSYAKKHQLSSISFSMELCSEAMGYNPNYKSDVTVSVNGVELFTYTLKGDYGDRYGKFTPSWWFVESTKYGELVNFVVNDDGVFVNEKLVTSNIKLSNLKLEEGNKTTLRLEVKKDAKNCGGLNIFGENFGDYKQNIEFLAAYKENKK